MLLRHRRHCIFMFRFEAILIPMFFVISVWGSRERRITAARLFVLYTAL
jgi:NADH:ubiquinone oxidoreductase subunit 4 (subunit M)